MVNRDDETTLYSLAGNCWLYGEDLAPPSAKVGTRDDPEMVADVDAWRDYYAGRLVEKLGGEPIRLQAVHRLAVERLAAAPPTAAGSDGLGKREWECAVDLCRRGMAIIRNAGAEHDTSARRRLLDLLPDSPNARTEDSTSQKATEDRLRRKKTEETTRHKEAASFEDLLVPAIPGLITSMVLDAVTTLNGLQKIALATCLGLLLWLVCRRQASRSRLSVVLRRAVTRQHWRWAVIGLAGLTVLTLIVTVLAFGRPTPTTAAVSLLALAILNAGAFMGRRLPAAIAAGYSGGIIGLCIGIAVV